ncbi:MAG: primosomal protein N', partial [Planctomycetaceae bacterium]|nr:primosomal protein N' [Planctomycetaceae bacterium]
PNVMLVGVINADAALHLADFRASERTCQLVTQVAGRSGRGPRGGRVVVQTSTPEHPAIRAAAAHDYEAFVRSELPIRKALLYPPFGSVIRIVVRSAVDEAAANWAKHLVERLSKSSQGDESIRILGPAPAPISRIRDRYRWHLQIHGPSSELLRNLVGQSMAGLKTPQEVVWVVDVDPVEML